MVHISPENCPGTVTPQLSAETHPIGVFRMLTELYDWYSFKMHACAHKARSTTRDASENHIVRDGAPTDGSKSRSGNHLQDTQFKKDNKRICVCVEGETAEGVILFSE